MEKLLLGQKKGESRIQFVSSESDQNIVRLKSKISVLERDDDLCRTKIAHMTTFLEDPVWSRVQEDVVRREYERIPSRERSVQQWELHRRRKEEACDQQFELFKPKMGDTVVKVLIV